MKLQLNSGMSKDKCFHYSSYPAGDKRREAMQQNDDYTRWLTFTALSCPSVYTEQGIDTADMGRSNEITKISNLWYVDGMWRPSLLLSRRCFASNFVTTSRLKRPHTTHSFSAQRLFCCEQHFHGFVNHEWTRLSSSFIDYIAMKCVRYYFRLQYVSFISYIFLSRSYEWHWSWVARAFTSINSQPYLFVARRLVWVDAVIDRNRQTHSTWNENLRIVPEKTHTKPHCNYQPPYITQKRPQHRSISWHWDVLLHCESFGCLFERFQRENSSTLAFEWRI